MDQFPHQLPPKMKGVKELVTEQSAIAKAIQAVTSKTPALAERMLNTLNLVLSGVQTSPQQDMAWKFSTLNSNGYPVEFTFSSMEKSVRYTVEVTGPEIDSGERLSRVEDLLIQMDVSHPFTKEIATFRQMQGDNPLKWGAWLGVRHLSTEDRYKIYAEVPEVGSTYVDEVISQRFGHRPLLANDLVRPTAIGHYLGSPWIEYYFIIDQFGLSFAQIELLLWQAGLYDRSRELLELIQETRGYLDPASAPGFMPAKYGFSYAISTEDVPTIFTFFAFARRLVGSDAEIRYNVLALAERRGWDMDAYKALTVPLATWEDSCSCHNVLAFVVPRQGPLGLHISLSPLFT
jgi:hypothetical protein